MRTLTWKEYVTFVEGATFTSHCWKRLQRHRWIRHLSMHESYTSQTCEVCGWPRMDSMRMTAKGKAEWDRANQEQTHGHQDSDGTGTVAQEPEHVGRSRHREDQGGQVTELASGDHPLCDYCKQPMTDIMQICLTRDTVTGEEWTHHCACKTPDRVKEKK